MIWAVENKTFAYERTFSEIKRLSSAGLEGPELLRRAAESMKRVVPFGSYCVASYDLTPREEEIVKHIARGRSTRHISGALFLSEHTVHNHLRSVFEKTGVHSRRELVQRLFSEDILPDTLGN
jgi:DNA-binding CsgD family transcriptional regulator